MINDPCDKPMGRDGGHVWVFRSEKNVIDQQVECLGCGCWMTLTPEQILNAERWG